MGGKTCLDDKKSCRAGIQMKEEKPMLGRWKDRIQSRSDEGRGQRPKRDRLMGKREAKRDVEMECSGGRGMVGQCD